MIYLYSSKRHYGLDELTTTLGAVRLYRFDGEDFWDKSRKKRLNIPTGSVIVPWGDNLPEMDGVRVLNGRELTFDKCTQYDAIVNVGLKAIKALPDGMNSSLSWSGMKSYIPRKFGERLLTGEVRVSNPDYYTEKVGLVKEFTIHSFNGKSIRAGEKKPMVGQPIAPNVSVWEANPTSYAHPWIRTYATGWSIDHTVPSTPELRAISHKVVKTLELDFAAIDIGQMANGTYIVVSVNQAPDLRGLNAVKAYTKSILKFIETGATSNATT